MREELAALRRRLAAAEARQPPVAVALARPVVASPVVGHSTAPLATITHVQAAVRGNQARQDPARALARAHSVLAPAAMLQRADSLRPARREGDDVEAARPPEISEEARAAQKKLQADRHGWAMGTALLVVLLELFALLDNRHWAVATLREAGDDVELASAALGITVKHHVEHIHAVQAAKAEGETAATPQRMQRTEAIRVLQRAKLACKTLNALPLRFKH